MKKTSDKVTELQKQVEELKTKYLRALADYQNLEKRTQERVEEVRSTAEEVLIKRLLPVIDALKQAKDHLKDKGIDLINQELHAALAASGFERIPAPQVNHELFNPHTMVCVEVVKGKNNVVVEEVLPGYRLRGKMIRPMQVKVGKEEIDQQAEELAQKELLKGDYM